MPKQPIPAHVRRAAVAMRRGGSTQPEIAAALKIGLGSVHRICAAAGAEAVGAEAQPVEAVAPPAGAPEDVPAGGEAAVVALGPGDAAAAELGRLERDLVQLRSLAAGSATSPSEKIRAHTSIGQISGRLALLRKEQRSIAAPGRDAAMLRAGHAAADKLRRLLEEALAEEPTDMP